MSLLYVSAWIPALTGLPMNRPGQALPGLAGWLHGIAIAFKTAFTEQPLLQVLVAAFVIGALCGLDARAPPGRARTHSLRRLDAERLSRSCSGTTRS